MGRVNLQGIESQSSGPPRRRREGVADSIETGRVQLAWRSLAFLVRHGGRRECVPPAFGNRNLLATVPGNITGGFTAGVGQLHGNTDFRVAPDCGDYAGNCGLPLVIPDAQTPW